MESSGKKVAFAGIDIGGSLAKFCIWIPKPYVENKDITHIEHLKSIINKLFENTFPTKLMNSFN